MHSFDDGIFDLLLHVPAAHAVQVELGGVVPYLPEPQSTHVWAPTAENCPASQSTHAVWSEPF